MERKWRIWEEYGRDAIIVLALVVVVALLMLLLVVVMGLACVHGWGTIEGSPEQLPNQLTRPKLRDPLNSTANPHQFVEIFADRQPSTYFVLIRFQFEANAPLVLPPIPPNNADSTTCPGLHWKQFFTSIRFGLCFWFKCVKCSNHRQDSLMSTALQTSKTTFYATSTHQIENVNKLSSFWLSPIDGWQFHSAVHLFFFDQKSFDKKKIN